MFVGTIVQVVINLELNGFFTFKAKQANIFDIFLTLRLFLTHFTSSIPTPTKNTKKMEVS